MKSGEDIERNRRDYNVPFTCVKDFVKFHHRDVHHQHPPPSSRLIFPVAFVTTWYQFQCSSFLILLKFFVLPFRASLHVREKSAQCLIAIFSSAFSAHSTRALTMMSKSATYSIYRCNVTTLLRAVFFSSIL